MSLQLLCFAPGVESGIIEVEIKPSNLISTLREVIYHKLKDLEHDVSLPALRLHKTDIPLEPEEDRARSARQYLENNPEDLKLDKRVNSLFPGGPHNDERIDILVTVAQVVPKRYRPQDDGQLDDHGEKRLRRSGGLESEDVDTYHELWKNLWRDSPSAIPYFKHVDIDRDGTYPEEKTPEKAWILEIPIKLASLLNTTPRNLLRDEFFAVTQAVMAKCDPKAPMTFSANDPSKGLVKGEDTTPPQGQDFVSGVAVVGQAGIGKSTFLRILLVLLIHAQCPVILQYDPAFVVFFSDQGVDVGSISDVKRFEQRHLETEKRRVFALVDSTLTLLMPDPRYYEGSPNIFTTHASSPRQQRLDWVSKASVEYFVLKTWTLKELLIARFLQKFVPKSEQAIAEFFRRFQPSARDAYRLGIEAYKTKVETATSRLRFDVLQKVVDDANSLHYHDELSHFVVTIGPSILPKTDDDDKGTNANANVDANLLATGTDMDTELLPGTDDDDEGENANDDADNLTLVINTDEDMKVKRTSWMLTIEGRETYDILARALQFSEAEEASRFFKLFIKNASSKTMAGYLLDDSIHTVFSAGGSWPLWDLKKSGTRGPVMQHYRMGKNEVAPTSYLHINESGFDITNNAEAAEPTSPLPTLQTLTYPLKPAYYQPPKGNPSFDAFIYSPKHSTALVFQASVGKAHDVNVKGIKDMSKLAGVDHIIYVVVTPPDTRINIAVAHGVDKMMKAEKYQIILRSLT